MKNKTKPLKHISFKVSHAMRERLERIAKSNDCTITEVVSTMIECAFEASDLDFVRNGGKL